MTITEPQAQALANLLHQIRPDWHTASLMTLLEKNQHHQFPELCKAAVQIANDHTKKTPAIIFMDGAHWDHPAAQPARSQQFLTSGEKNRLSGAQRAGYMATKYGIDPTDATHPFHTRLITPDDLNPAATIEAFQRGQKIAEWELSQEPAQLAIEGATS